MYESAFDSPRSREIASPFDAERGLAERARRQRETLAVLQRLKEDPRTRHIPVVENGKVLGIVTIGDMVKLIVIQQEKTIKQLESYIAGDLAAE